MGFGTLFIGYFLLLNLTYYRFTDLIAALLMLLAFYKLREINRHFRVAIISSGLFAAIGAIELAEALAQLGDDDRDIVLLSIIGGLNSTEIAALTGLAPGSVRSKLSRSLAKMREFLS